MKQSKLYVNGGVSHRKSQLAEEAMVELRDADVT